MVHLDLFSGIGGFALACQWAGLETIGFVEIDKYCQEVLRKHWPNVLVIGDIKDVEKIKEIMAYANEGRCSPNIRETIPQGEDSPESDTEFGSRSRTGDAVSGASSIEKIKEIVADTAKPESSMDRRIIGLSQSRELRRSSSTGTMESPRTGNAESPTILVTAGFPCQPFSVAGKRQGEADNRYLWPETLTVIKAIKPQWVLLENVTGIAGIPESASASEMEPKAIKAVYDYDLRFENEYTKHRKVSVAFQNIQQRILYKIITDLEEAGYELPRTRQGQPIVLCVPACAINAWHRRDRVWIVANSKQLRWRGRDNGNERRMLGTLQTEGPSSNVPDSEQPTSGRGGFPRDIGDSQRRAAEAKREGIQPTDGATRPDNLEPSSQDVANTHNSRSGTPQSRINRDRTKENEEWRGQPQPMPNGQDWWAVEPELGRVAHGIPHRVDRLKCLGNAIVPQVAYEIIKVIKDLA